MNPSGSLRKKNWQWRVIVWASLFLIFGKSFGHWAYNALGIEQAYTTTASVAKKVGLSEVLNSNTSEAVPLSSNLVIDVRNDTPNEYTVETKTVSGYVDYLGHTLSAGGVKRFTLKPQGTEYKTGLGDILFLSAPLSGSNNTTCQEVHTLNFDLKEASQIKQPLAVNLSSIASKMDCKNNATQPSE